ncbi:MAG: 3-hydroxyacyl-CoA dehydrogenase family protein [Gemmatimonadales bacterium]
MAQVAALAGWQVRLTDARPDALPAAFAAIRRNLEASVSRGKVLPEARDAALARLETTDSVASACRGTDLVIEAVVEDLEVKREVFRQAAGVARPDTLLASNTSSLSIAAIAAALPGPERVLGLHFFNPVHLMRLVEVVVHRGTSDASLETALGVVRGMGKEPIVVKDSPGFASSRLGVALGLEAMRMLEQGVADAEDIDKAMVLGYNHPMGPLRLTDLVGLDVRLKIAEHLHQTLGAEHFRPPDLLRRLVAEGKLGKKAGQGFYEWGEG